MLWITHRQYKFYCFRKQEGFSFLNNCTKTVVHASLLNWFRNKEATLRVQLHQSAHVVRLVA